MASSLRASTRLSCSRDTASSNQPLSMRRPVSSTVSNTPTASTLTMLIGDGLPPASTSKYSKGAAARQ
ncbi:hypothetical protein D3C80_2122060 [compost metagenome]